MSTKPMYYQPLNLEVRCPNTIETRYTVFSSFSPTHTGSLDKSILIHPDMTRCIRPGCLIVMWGVPGDRVTTLMC